ncbi:unnamed protein product [Ilex paraguariensis]
MGTSPRTHALTLSTLFFVLIVAILISISQARTLKSFNNSISIIFVFGDSTVDPGNNNYIGTPFKSNFPPYGRDFVNHTPTGRFSNGRLVTDFIASYLGVKDYVPPYLDPTLSIEELMTGVSFASAGSGFDPLTPMISGVIPMSKQLEYFREYKCKLELAIGKRRTTMLINKAAFIVSAGTNDFVVNYFGTPIRRQSYTVSGYQQFLMQLVRQFIQGLLNEGAQKIAMVGLPPMGCLPEVITLSPDAIFHQRQCVQSLLSIARDYNQILRKNLKAMHSGSSTRFFYADIYQPLSNMIQGHSSGFEEVSTGCCGSGYIETSFMCNSESAVCKDASKYVFWDSIHPTEAAYYILFEALRPTIDIVFKE